LEEKSENHFGICLNLNYAATNLTKWTTFVDYQRHESIKKPMNIASTKNQCS